jgi:hypothetical protein
MPWEHVGKINTRDSYRSGIEIPVINQSINVLLDLDRKKRLFSLSSYQGALGTVANRQQHLLPMEIVSTARQVAAVLGEDIAQEHLPGKQGDGITRLVGPVVRTSVQAVAGL